MTAIILYGRTACHPCRLAKTQFEKAGVPFRYVDVHDEPAALEGLTELDWVTALPVVVTDDPEIGEWCALKPDRFHSRLRRVTVEHQLSKRTATNQQALLKSREGSHSVKDEGFKWEALERRARMISWWIMLAVVVVVGGLLRSVVDPWSREQILISVAIVFAYFAALEMFLYFRKKRRRHSSS